MRTERNRTIPDDWHPGVIPENVELGEDSYIQTSYSFLLYRSNAEVGLQLGRGAGIYTTTLFDVGEEGRVRIGECALVNALRIVCDTEIEIGDYALISWNVTLMDTYRLPFDPLERRRELERIASMRSPRRIEGQTVSPQPIRIGNNVWIGFDTCILPGVTIGEGSIVGARSVVTEDVAPYTIVAGNPARVIRRLPRDEEELHGS